MRTPSLNYSDARRAGGLFAATILIPLAVSVLFFRNTLFSFSADLVHHTALAEALRHTFLLRPDMQAFLGEMYVYPNLSHRIAALWLNLGADPIDALNLTGVTAACIVWLCLLGLVWRVSAIGGAAFAVVSAALIYLARPGLVTGFEIIGNFFYAQIVGDALFVLGAISTVIAMRRFGAAWALGVGLVTVFVCAQAHLLGGLRMASAGALILALHAWESQRAGRADWMASTGIIALPLSLALNPAFSAMRKIAENDGSLDVGALSSPVAILVLALAIGLAAIAALAPPVLSGNSADKDEANLAAQCLYILAASIAAAAALQSLALLVAHQGSPYAVKKHAFALVAIGVAIAAALIGRRLNGRITLPALTRPTVNVAALLIAFSVIAGALFGRPSVFDTDRLYTLYRGIEALKPSLPAASPNGGPVFLASDLPAAVNYYETVALLNAPRDANAFSILAQNRVEDYSTVSAVLTVAGDSAYDVQECRKASSGTVVAIAVECLSHGAGLTLDAPVAFSIGGSGVPMLGNGWSAPETWGTWSDGNNALLKASIASDLPAGPLAMELTVRGFVTDVSPRRIVKIGANGAPAKAFTIDASKPITTLTLPLNDSALRKTGTLTLLFEISNPASPASIGLSKDKRLLGLGLQQIRLLRVAG